MSKSMFLLDSRVEERLPRRPAYHVMRINCRTSLSWCFDRIRNYGLAHGGIDRLLVHCHGYEDLHAERNRTVVRGDGGLELGREGLDLRNVRVARRLRGQVRTIVLFACSAADTHPSLEGTVHDGQRFCGELAVHSGAEVYAADVTQECMNALSCGRWEGNVYRFGPDGQPGRRVESNPLFNPEDWQ